MSTQSASATTETAKAGSVGVAKGAVLYTALSLAQRASGLIMFPLIVRAMSPGEYGRVSLLTAAGGLLAALLGFGLEPRIVHAHFKRSGDELDRYLTSARTIAFWFPIILGLVASAALLALIPEARLKSIWVYETLGTALLAAGTTFAYAQLRARRAATRYSMFAGAILILQVGSRAVAVLGFEAGSLGWAVSDFITGAFATVVAIAVYRTTLLKHRRRDPLHSTLLDALPLVPHYAFQWGLAFADRFILVGFTTAAVLGGYAAVYQLSAVLSLLMSEVNRSLMPSYASADSGSDPLGRLAGQHLLFVFATFGLFTAAGYFALTRILPPDYQASLDLFPTLSLGALLYACYFIPMNSLTLVAGRADRSAAISGLGFVTNVALNLLLVPFFEAWGSAVATLAGYAVLVGVAVYLDRDQGQAVQATPFRGTLRQHGAVLAPIIGGAAVMTAGGAIAVAGAVVTSVAGLVLLFRLLRDSSSDAVRALASVPGLALLRKVTR